MTVHTSATVLKLCCPEGCLHSGVPCGSWGNERGRPGDQGTGKNRFFSPRARFGVSPHARPHTYTCSASTTPPSQRTNTNAICQPSFLCSLLLFLSSHSAGRAGALLLVGWFQWFSSHSGVFQRFVTIFSYFHAHKHTLLYSEHTIKITRGLVFRSFKSHTRDY